MPENKQIAYLDNAATTQPDPKVVEVMVKFLNESYGNPSSVHALGRNAKVRIEEARREIAYLFNARTSEIFFTSGGSESLVTALRGVILGMGIHRIITSKAEHLAVLHALEHLRPIHGLAVHNIDLNKDGTHDLEHLEALLHDKERSLVCLMHANNVIGTLLPLDKVGDICRRHDAIFLCDTVQTIGKYQINPHQTGIHLAACSAHKIHGPKGVGFLYVDKSLKLEPLIYGGGQERGLRSGTENTMGIVGMHTALDLAMTQLESNRQHIEALKAYTVEKLKSEFDDVQFVGNSDQGGLYNLINVSFKEVQRAGMLQFNLDMAGIAISTGSACSSGATKPSHVLKAIRSCEGRKAIRISFSKYNTKEEVDAFITAIKKYLS